MTGLEIYEAWAAFRPIDSSRLPMGKAGLEQSAVVWKQWLIYCAGKQLPWDKATKEDIRDFLDKLKPRTTRPRPTASPVTVKRYWRIVNDLYAYAVLQEFLAANPCALDDKLAPERKKSLALNSTTWQLLSDGLPGGFTEKDRRNRLILLLAMRCALTVSEIVQAKVADISEATPFTGTVSESLAFAGMPLFQPESPFWVTGEAHPIYRLEVKSEKFSKLRPARGTVSEVLPMQMPQTPKSITATRVLILDARTSKAVFDWLEVRNRSNRKSARLIIGEGEGMGMIPKAIYNICRTHIIKCLGADAGSIEHLGPNTLRNTCIAIWRNLGVSDAEVARRIGLRDIEALSRLNDHKMPEIHI
jgi:integrase